MGCVGEAGQCPCEDGLQKAVDLRAGGLAITGKKKMSHLASRRRMWGNYRQVSLTLGFRKIVGEILLTAMSGLL